MASELCNAGDLNSDFCPVLYRLLIIKKLIKEYNKNGMTIFLTTHDMEVANELCDRIAILNQGKIIGLDTPENLRKLKQEFQAIDFYFENEVNEGKPPLSDPSP